MINSIIKCVHNVINKMRMKKNISFLTSFNWKENLRHDFKSNPQSKAEFMSAISNYIEADLVRIIYSDNNISILNLANDVYAVSDYNKNNAQQFYCFLISKKLINDLIEDYNFLYYILKEWGEKETYEQYYPFNESFYTALKKVKYNTDINGPSKLIDLALEKKIIKKYIKN